MIRRCVDALAKRLGYVRDVKPLTRAAPPTANSHFEDEKATMPVDMSSGVNCSAWPPQPEDYGFTSDAKFTVTRGGQTSDRLTSFAEVADFLDACGLRDDEVRVAAILSGWPFEVDGATMSFKAQH